ncbi:MAG: hypothetical protein J5651_06485 [Salinivirgaceae bacterium]|nr:hypothetical protein [Salinivirgaceae bacterium]
MTYATAQHFINEAQKLGAEDKIRIINILLNSFKPSQQKMSDSEVMSLFDHFTGRLKVGEGFDLKEEKCKYLDERYGI